VRVVIIGAGVAGLGIGWRLLQAGAQVTILERAQPAAGASWAAAGMLAVTAELEEAAEAERALALRANQLWPRFAAELEAASGRSVFLSRVGALLLASDRDQLQGMQARARGDLRVLDAQQARTLVPLLGDTLGGLWSPHEAHVDNRALGEALAIAFLKAGGLLNANEAVVALDPGPSVLTPYARYEADASKRTELYKQASKIIQQGASRIPLVQADALVAATKKVRGLVPHPIGVEAYAQVWLGK